MASPETASAPYIELTNGMEIAVGNYVYVITGMSIDSLLKAKGRLTLEAREVRRVRD